MTGCHRTLSFLFCTFLLLACAEDPHKHPDENASAKRTAQIFKELEHAQQDYIDGVALQTKSSKATDPNEIQISKKSAQDTLNKARTAYIAVLRRDDLEKVEGSYSRYDLEMIILDIDTRLRQLSTDSIEK